MFWLRDAIDQVFYPDARNQRREHIRNIVEEKYERLDVSIKKLTAVTAWSLRASELLADVMTGKDLDAQ